MRREGVSVVTRTSWVYTHKGNDERRRDEGRGRSYSRIPPYQSLPTWGPMDETKEEEKPPVFRDERESVSRDEHLHPKTDGDSGVRTEEGWVYQMYSLVSLPPQSHSDSGRVRFVPALVQETGGHVGFRTLPVL